jgi:hypothetical protein
MMSIGERSKITITPEYAYGDKGLYPLIPPHSTVTFDIMLLGFKMRSKWVKPLLQGNLINKFDALLYYAFHSCRITLQKHKLNFI